MKESIIDSMKEGADGAQSKSNRSLKDEALGAHREDDLLNMVNSILEDIDEEKVEPQDLVRNNT